MDEQNTSSKRTWIIGGVIILLILVGVGAYFFISKGKGSSGISSFTSLFGNLGENTDRPKGGDILPGTSLPDGTASGDSITEEPLFRQLANFPVAGAIALIHNNTPVVRYIARENGFTYEVDPKTGKTTQLTNTTIPRIYEAYWGNNGNSVTLRYLTRDSRQQDTIKTYIAYLSLPETMDIESTSSPILGTLTGDFLPDNISEISISPDGTKLFYLVSVENGVSGTIVNIATKSAKEVLRSTFSEWLPELQNDGSIVLTTKPSAKIPGFSYLYNPTDKSYSRLIRDVNGLTTLANPSSKRVLYSSNIAQKTTLNIYDPKGYAGDEGLVFHNIPVPLATLPEKCIWAMNHIRLFCGAFVSSPSGDIPDDWYQGTLSLSDSFWTINSDNSEISFLADPSKEVTANQNFDVFRPFIGSDENHFFFVNKKDSTLWSMRIMKEKYMTIDEEVSTNNVGVELTPDELKDAAGSIN